MGFFPNLFQNPQTSFKGKKWAKRQENSWYYQHRNRLLKARPVVDTDPPRAYHILTKRLLYKRRRMNFGAHGVRSSANTVPDTESLKDWKACRRQQQPPDQSAAQLKRLISAEELTHSLAELERSATKALGRPPTPPPSVASRPTLSSSQLVEQVHELERSLTDLVPLTPLPPLQSWVNVRRAERVVRPVATEGGVAVVPPSRGVVNSVAGGVIGGSVSEVSLSRTSEAAGDFWIASKQLPSAPITPVVRQVSPYVTINNQKVPIVFRQYSVEAHQKVKNTIALQPQENPVLKQEDIRKPIKEQNGIESAPQKSETEMKNAQQKKAGPVTNLTLVVDDAMSKAAAIDGNQGQKGIPHAYHQGLPVEPDTGESVQHNSNHEATKKSDNHVGSNNDETKMGNERQGSLRAPETNSGHHTNSPNSISTKEPKTKKRKPVRASKADITRENHSDTEVETTERKNKLETGSQGKRTSYSDNTQPVKIFFKRRPTNPKIDYIELADRSTQTVQHTQSDILTSHASRQPQHEKHQHELQLQPEKGLSGRSKSEHAIQSHSDDRPANRRFTKPTAPGGSGTAGGPDSGAAVQERPPVLKPLTDRSEARAAPVAGHARSPISPVRAIADTHRRAAPPVRQQPSSSARQQPSSARKQQQEAAGPTQQQSSAAARSSGRHTAPATPRSQWSGGRGPPTSQQSRGITTTIKPPARPGSGRGKTSTRRKMQKLRGKIKEPAGRLSRGNAANIITTPGDSRTAAERRATQASCAMCVGDPEPQSRTERVKRVIHRVTAVISPDSSPPASPGRSTGSPPAAARRHRQLLTRIEALATPRRRYTEEATNHVRTVRSTWRPPPPAPGDQLYQRAMRGASCRSCNIVRTPSPISSNPFTFMDIEADGRPLGRLTILLRADLAPRTVENFRSLCTGEYGFGYQGTLFHRVIPRFVCQGGDVTFGGRNKQAPLSIYDRLFEDESFEMHHSEPGVVSMVNNGPNTNGTQFFICAAKITWLDGKNVAFGLVTEGLQVLRKIEALGTAQGVPLKRVVVHNCGQITDD